LPPQARRDAANYPEYPLPAVMQLAGNPETQGHKVAVAKRRAMNEQYLSINPHNA